MRYTEGRYVIVSEGFTTKALALAWGKTMLSLLTKYGASVYVADIAAQHKTQWVVIRSITKRDYTEPRFIHNQNHDLVPAMQVWEYRVRTRDASKSRMLVNADEISSKEMIK